MSDEIIPNIQTPQTEPISEPVETIIPSEPKIPTIEPEPTAQIPVNEPFTFLDHMQKKQPIVICTLLSRHDLKTYWRANKR